MQLSKSGRTARTMLAASLVAAFTIAAPAAAGPAKTGCDNRNLRTVGQLTSCVNASDVRGHLAELQAIADANGGTRASGTPGYDASADYVAGLLEDAGYDVTRQVFAFSLYTENATSLTNDGAAVETQSMSFSGSGDLVGANVIPVDLDLGLGNASSSGCEATDFDGLDFSGSNDLALIQRGACAFGDKALNAEAAGAEGVVIFNQGNADGRFGIIGGTLGEGVVGTLTIPVLDVAYDDGVAILNAAAGAVSMSVDATTTTNSTENIIADLDGKNTDNVVMAGAHLDSVAAGPGINDNGSGSAAILTIALALTESGKYTPQNSLRFAWWGAEESGLIGSTEYIFNPDFGISDEDYFALAAYLNFDMVGSPNYIFGVYDADESTFDAPVPVPAGSAALEDLFEAFYTANDVPYDDSEFSGRSDYQAFINVGIPASGLFTGAEGIKSDEQAAIWGGTAGDQFDPCYHLACDTIDNLSMNALEINVDAIADSVFRLAASTELVNGVKGVTVPGPAQTDIAGPEGTWATGGGGLHADHVLVTQ